MGKWRREAFNELQGLAETTAKRRDVASAAQRKTLINEEVTLALTHAIAPQGIVNYTDILKIPEFDDGLPPATAKNIKVTPIIEGLAVQWDVPPVFDRVKKANVQLSPGGVFKATDTLGHTFLGLDPHTQYSVRVELIDFTGASSGWSTQVVGTPVSSAMEEIDLTAYSILGRLKGLLPNTNLATIQDAAKLGDDVILARAMATQDSVAINSWIQNAAIVSAKVASLVADKIIGGTISTTDIFVASKMRLASGGQLLAGAGLTLDPGGMSLLPEDTFREPAANRSRKIGPLVSPSIADWAAMSFFDQAQSGANIRGVSIRSDGDAGVRKGGVILHATKNGDVSATSTARLEVVSSGSGSQSGPSTVSVYQNLWVKNNADAVNFFLRSGGSLASVKNTAEQALSRAQGSIRWSEVIVRSRDGVLVSKSGRAGSTST